MEAAGGYEALAPVYERTFGPEAAEASWRAVERLLLPGLKAGGRVLELCCGTGEMTARLLARGYRVTAVDRSPAMLAYARERAAGAEVVEADIRSFKPRGRFGAALCAYNSLPHITDADELGGVVAMVRRALAPGGRLVFDLYDEAAYANGWQGRIRAGRGAGACWLEARFDAARRRGRTRVRWRGGAAELEIRCYTERELRGLLRAAGFTRLRRWQPLLDGRVYWRCE
jgi:SAM-dependent methyltransferase